MKSCYDAFASRGDPWMTQRESGVLYPVFDHEDAFLDQHIKEGSKKRESHLLITPGTKPSLRPPSTQLRLTQKYLAFKRAVAKGKSNA